MEEKKTKQRNRIIWKVFLQKMERTVYLKIGPVKANLYHHHDNISQIYSQLSFESTYFRE